MNQNNPHSLEENIEFIEFIFNMLTSRALNPELYEDILSKCLDKRSPIGHTSLLESGYFQASDFIDYYQKITGLGIPLPVFHQLLFLLEKEEIIISAKPGTIFPDGKTLYYANTKAIDIYKNKTFKNILFGFQYIVRRYKEYIFKIQIQKRCSAESEDVNISIGTGFLIDSSVSLKPLIITNKHVVQDANSIEIIDSYQNILEYSEVVVDEGNDIAALVLKEEYSKEALTPNINLNILDEIITIGFPKVPTTKDAYVVAHKGEINSFVENYWNEKRFLISARTSPGSSGSLIIDKTGRFVGIVVEELFEEDSFKERGIIPYYSGIPASEILNFIQRKFPKIIGFGGPIIISGN